MARTRNIQRATRAALYGLALASLLFESGCSGSASASDQAVLAAAPGSPDLLQRLPVAAFDTAYRGERELEFSFEVGGEARSLSYTEDVGTDGSGQFAIETLDVFSGATDPEWFRIVQDTRQNFMYRYRDFRIENSARFQQNYKLSVIATDEEVAGQDCLTLAIERNAGARSRYEVAVDARTGLVLRWEERSLDGALMGRMRFTSLEYVTDAAQLADLALREIPSEQSVDPRDLELELLEPQLIPDGYELDTVALTTIDVDGLGTQTWIKRTYGDGVDRVFFLHQPRAADYVHDGSRPSEVRHMEGGPWNLITGEVNGFEVILLGKVGDTELLDMLQSALR